jgi:hypothetical protein
VKSKAKLRLDKSKANLTNTYDDWAAAKKFQLLSFLQYEKAAEEHAKARSAYEREQSSTNFVKRLHNSIIKFLIDHQGL